MKRCDWSVLFHLEPAVMDDGILSAAGST